MLWKNDRSPCSKKFQTAPSVGKQMIMIWDVKSILMVEWFPQVTSLNHVIYYGILMSSLSSLTTTTTTYRVVSASWCLLFRKTDKDWLLHPWGCYQKVGDVQ
jgi:hypothetical protein